MQKFKNTFRYLLPAVILIALFTSCSLSPALFFNHHRSSDQKFTKIGHRGARGLAPENTLSAIAEGLKDKADRIEIDVHQTKDGKVVVMHDAKVDRTTNGHGLIKNYTYTDLSALDAGSWFDKKFANEKVPTLDETIKFIHGQADLIIEIKRGDDYYPNIIENILKIIKDNNAGSWCIIHSFYTDVLAKVHVLEPSIRLHKLFVCKIKFLPVLVGKGFEIYNFNKYSYISEYSLNYHFANKGIIKRIKSKGKKVNVWVLNDQRIINNLISIGVDGIITDFPDRLK